MTEPTPPLTEEQINWTMTVFHDWLALRRLAGQEPSISNTASFTKSCLLGRMLRGKPPLADPPPTFAAAPWYELVENGDSGPFDAAFTTRIVLDSMRHTEGDVHYPKWVVGGCDDWVEIWQNVNGNHVVLDRVHRWDRTKLMGERWLMSKVSSLGIDGERHWRIRRIDEDLAMLLSDMGAPGDIVNTPEYVGRSCRYCGVGPEDDCTMDCPSRDAGFTEEPT